MAFRARDGANYELLYVRPHNSGRPDALQYAPVCNGVTGWQLYSGDGFTALVDLPAGRWLHLRIELAGSRARVFLDGADQPAEVKVLVDGTSGYLLCADLEVVPEHGLVVVPSFDGGDLTAYRVESLAPGD